MKKFNIIDPQQCFPVPHGIPHGFDKEQKVLTAQSNQDSKFSHTHDTSVKCCKPTFTPTPTSKPKNKKTYKHVWEETPAAIGTRVYPRTQQAYGTASLKFTQAWVTPPPIRKKKDVSRGKRHRGPRRAARNAAKISTLEGGVPGTSSSMLHSATLERDLVHSNTTPLVDAEDTGIERSSREHSSAYSKENPVPRKEARRKRRNAHNSPNVQPGPKATALNTGTLRKISN